MSGQIIASMAKQFPRSRVEIAAAPLGPRNDSNQVFNRAIELLYCRFAPEGGVPGASSRNAANFGQLVGGGIG